jgi:acylaminoacyl-peptidase
LFRCCAESDCSFFQDLPEIDENYNALLLKMLKHSPIIHVNKVKAPTLIALGSKDLRVPPSQGKLWYNRLSSNNVITK